MCVTGEEKQLNIMRKDLTLMEQVVICQFAFDHAPLLCSKIFTTHQFQSLLNVLTSIFVNLLKHDMCKGVTRRQLIQIFDWGGFEETDDDTLNDLVVYMTRSYCRMRGKDFVCKYIYHCTIYMHIVGNV